LSGPPNPYREEKKKKSTKVQERIYKEKKRTRPTEKETLRSRGKKIFAPYLETPRRGETEKLTHKSGEMDMSETDEKEEEAFFN